MDTKVMKRVLQLLSLPKRLMTHMVRCGQNKISCKTGDLAVT